MSQALPPPGQRSSVSNAVEAASAGSKLSKMRSATARARRSSLTRRTHVRGVVRRQAFQHGRSDTPDEAKQRAAPALVARDGPPVGRFKAAGPRWPPEAQPLREFNERKWKSTKGNERKTAFISFHFLFRIGTFQWVIGEKNRKIRRRSPLAPEVVSGRLKSMLHSHFLRPEKFAETQSDEFKFLT